MGFSGTPAQILNCNPNVPIAQLPSYCQSTPQSIGQRVSFPVQSGHTYTLTKYVGVLASQPGSATVTTAAAIASDAALTGWNALVADNRADWASLWRGRIDDWKAFIDKAHAED